MTQEFEFVRRTHQLERIRLIPEQGNTAAQILELLNGNEAMLEGDRVVRYAEPPAEGCTVLALVTSQAVSGGHSDWVNETAQEQERKVVQAANLRYQADMILAGGDCEEAETLLKAAWVLWGQAGSPQDESRIWLINTEAAIAHKCGAQSQARERFQTAHQESRVLLGDEDPVTLVCLGNYGQFLAETGDAEGEVLLKAAIQGLKAAKPVRQATQDWIDGGIGATLSNTPTN